MPVNGLLADWLQVGGMMDRQGVKFSECGIYGRTDHREHWREDERRWIDLRTSGIKRTRTDLESEIKQVNARKILKCQRHGKVAQMGGKGYSWDQLTCKWNI